MPGTLKNWQRRASPLARQALCGYAALIVYASLYPFSGWRSLGLSPFAYLLDPQPQYLTGFDVLTNILGYMPFGMLLVLALYPRRRNGSAVLRAWFWGALLSASMEAIQTYLPTRVASNLDLASNALGALLGGALAAPFCSALLDRGTLRRWRLLWFDRQGSLLMGLVLLWPFAQIYPVPDLFGSGNWPRVLWQSLDPGTQAVLQSWLPAWMHAGPPGLDSARAAVLCEALVTALALLAVGSIATLAMRPQAPRRRLLLILLLVTVGIKGGATALQSASGLSFEWLTIGAQSGLLFGSLVVLATCGWSTRARATLAALSLVSGMLLVNLLPVNPYYSMSLDDWRQGQFVHFNGLAQWLSWIWPYLALAWLARLAEQTWVARHAGATGRSRRGSNSVS
jgi:VanZ family protein